MQKDSDTNDRWCHHNIYYSGVMRPSSADWTVFAIAPQVMGRAGVEVTSFNIGPKDRVKVLIRLV